MIIKQTYNVFIIFVCILLGGCSVTSSIKSTQSRHLKVMYYSDLGLYKEYGDIFLAKYDDIDLEFVDMRNIDYASYNDDIKALTAFINKEKPDVLLLGADQYVQYEREGMLMKLDPLIQRDHYDIQGLHPLIIELLKEQGGGELYGLSPRFYSPALYYNMNLFKKYGIEAPQNNMTWQEILELAKRFPLDGNQNDRIYGFGTLLADSLDTLGSRIAFTQNLAAVNPNNMKVTVNTDTWKNVWSLALDSIQSGTFYIPDVPFMGGSLDDYYKSNPFLQGRMAMTLDGNNILQDMKDLKEKNKDFKDFELGIVTGPVDPLDRESSRDIEVQEIFSIREGTSNQEAAWDFIKFVNSDEYASVKSRQMDGNLLTRTGYYKENGVGNLAAFYTLRPKIVNYSSESKIPNEFEGAFSTLTSSEIQSVRDKKVTLDEALNKIQTEGQFILDQALKNQDSSG